MVWFSRDTVQITAMQVWKLTLAYDGTPYFGWQVQPGLATVQGTVADAIHGITRERVLPQGSGRTDTGVHALGQVASFALETPIPPESFRRALNRRLPGSIRVVSAEHAPEDFHARHWAVAKTYEYRVFPLHERPWVEGEERDERICPPTLAPFCWACPWALELAALNQAAEQVVGEHDFTSFAASDPRGSNPVLTPVRRVWSSRWTAEGETLVYRVRGSGFLHHMVRNLVGTFVLAGSGRISPKAMGPMLAARSRSVTGPTSPASGLFLVNVEYGTRREAAMLCGEAGEEEEEVE